MAACNDSTPLRSANEAAQEQSAEEERAKFAESKESTSDGAAKSDGEEKGDGSGGGDKGDKPGDPSGFDRDMAKIVLERARKQAVQCPAVDKDTPTGEGDIEIDFDGASGKIVDVKLAPPFTSGSKDGQECLRAAFLGQIVPPFTGTKELSYTLKVPAAAPDKAGKDKGGSKKKKP